MSEHREINALIDEYAVTTVMSRAELTAVARTYPDEDMVRWMLTAKANNPGISWPWLAWVYRNAPTLTFARADA